MLSFDFLKKDMPPVNGKRAGRVIASLILIFGIFLLAAGSGYTTMGKLGKARYEKSTGKLIRLISNEDKSNYQSLDSAIAMGRAFQVLGVVLVAVGVLCWVYPGFLLLILKVDD